jgi:hypothetical protein
VLSATVSLNIEAEFYQVSTGRKTAHIGVVGLCTDGMEKQILLMEHRSLRRELIEIGTKNKMSREPDYQHITEFQQLQQLVDFSFR